MASQFAPESLPIIDPGNIPFYWIDGFESFSLKEGCVFARCFAVKPIVQAVIDFSPWRPHVAKICVELGFSIETRMAMRRQGDEALRCYEAARAIGSARLLI